ISAITHLATSHPSGFPPPAQSFFSVLYTLRRLPRSTLFPYTTLFRSCLEPDVAATARRAMSAALDDLGSATFRADLASLRHETRSEEHTSELQSPDHLVCRPLLEKKNSNLRHCS